MLEPCKTLMRRLQQLDNRQVHQGPEDDHNDSPGNQCGKEKFSSQGRYIAKGGNRDKTHTLARTVDSGNERTKPVKGQIQKDLEGKEEVVDGLYHKVVEPQNHCQHKQKERIREGYGDNGKTTGQGDGQGNALR